MKQYDYRLRYSFYLLACIPSKRASSKWREIPHVLIKFPLSYFSSFLLPSPKRKLSRFCSIHHIFIKSVFALKSGQFHDLRHGHLLFGIQLFGSLHLIFTRFGRVISLEVSCINARRANRTTLVVLAPPGCRRSTNMRRDPLRGRSREPRQISHGRTVGAGEKALCQGPRARRPAAFVLLHPP